jgi:hypothetical protein
MGTNHKFSAIGCAVVKWTTPKLSGGLTAETGCNTPQELLHAGIVLAGISAPWSWYQDAG